MQFYGFKYFDLMLIISEKFYFIQSLDPNRDYHSWSEYSKD